MYTYSLDMRKQDRTVRVMVTVKPKVHIHSRNEKARCNGQMHGQSQTNKLTYRLEMRKPNKLVRHMVRVKLTSSHTPYMSKQQRIVRSMIRVKSTTSHTI